MKEVRKMGAAKKVIGAGIVGTALGAAAGAATVMLADKKNREKALKKAKELRSSAEKTVDTLQKKAQSVAKKVDEVKQELLKASQEQDKTEDEKLN
jgi:gas vesicle protein